MADISVPVAVTATVTTTAKPGYKTTEFYGAWAAKILGALLVSGLLADGSIAMRITGAAVFVLAQLGYTWSRTAVKTAVLLLLVGALAPAQTACTPAQRSAAATTAGRALVNCTAQQVGTTPALDLATLAAIANTVAAERLKCTPPGGALNWSCVETDAIGDGVTLGGCAFVQLVAAAAKAVSSSGSALVAGSPAPPPGRAELEDFRARAGGVIFHTAAGDQ